MQIRLTVMMIINEFCQHQKKQHCDGIFLSSWTCARIEFFLVTISSTLSFGGCSENRGSTLLCGTPRWLVTIVFGKEVEISFNFTSKGYPTRNLFQSCTGMAIPFYASILTRKKGPVPTNLLKSNIFHSVHQKCMLSNLFSIVTTIF